VAGGDGEGSGGSEGREVAVKVQRAGLRETVGIDLYVLRLVAGRLKRLLKLRSDLEGMVDEFGKSLFEEMDYIHEANNAKRSKPQTRNPNP
jgi:predicted unusual protein kinase regulating ubiquinone biosynthesis (AarF/ABC1/UbiB family)